VDEGASFSQLTRDLVAYGRDLLLLTVGYEGVSTLSDAQKKTRHALANAIGRARLMTIVENLRATEKEMRQSTDHRLLLELALVRAASGIEARPAAPALSVASPTGSTPGPPLAAPPGFQAPRPSAKIAPAETPDKSSTGEAQEIPAEKPRVPKPHTEPASSPERPQPVWRTDSAQAGSTPGANETPEPASDLQPPSPKKKGRRIHNMAEFIELWPHVLMRIRKKIGITAVAYLHDAYPYALSASDATLVFQKEFHYEKACEAAKSHPFEQVVNECLDAPRQLKFVLAEPRPEPVKAVEPEPAPTDDDDEEENIFAMTQQLFAAEIVEQ
jgi:DNA polymerase-3 subunit gamma/tau